MIQDPMAVLAVLLSFLALLFSLNATAFGERVFRVIPLLVFAYFVPTALSNNGIIPVDHHFELYVFVKTWLLPASLVLLVLSVDVPAILGLGRSAVAMFLAATISIVIGGPLALLILKGLVPSEMGDQAWKGLAALCGSWIGGGANFTAIGESVGATDSTLSLMVVIDVAIANIWMAFLLGFAGREKEMDAKMGADRDAIDRVREKVESFHAEVARPTNLPDLLSMLGLAFGITAVAKWCAPNLPESDIVSEFTWGIIIVTSAAMVLSFTRVRRLEGAGASKLGSVFLYLLVATIGAKAEFSKVLEPENVGLLAIGALWMCFHIIILMGVRRLLKAPIFFAAVGSQANVGGAASAPIVASAFHPALAPVGVLLAVAGYVLGIYAALLCASLLSWVARSNFVAF
ncbi:MAG: DUF819 family protein [Planctomycetota bacterium]|jgi:uncharacterized membrane protein|nr:DUF819 family protein [Planctomycetota bacterium]